MEQLKQLKQVEQVEQLELLEQLEPLEQLEQLEQVALQVPQFSTAAASQGDVKVSDILLSEENPAMASAAHETHVATNTARSSATAPIVPLTRFGSL